MARSGSMWTYNLTRTLLRDLLPRSASLDTVYCRKSHHLVRSGLPGIWLICTYRDVREAMVSFMEFARCDFERAFSALSTMIRSVEHYLEADAPGVLGVRYDEIVGTPLKIARDIVDFLGLTPSPQALAEAVEQLSPQRVQAILDTLDDSENRENAAMVSNHDGSCRRFHARTGFQSGHITGRGKHWRQVLNPAQPDRVMEIAEPWLQRYGYSG